MAILLILPAIGIVYTLAAALLLGRARPPASEQGPAPSVTILKPLHGAEPRLAEMLRGTLAQDYPAPVQLVCGLAHAGDPAAAIARAIGAELVIDGRRHGTNAKVSNLANMRPRVRHELVVISDSDIAVPPDYLRCVAAALSQPGVGAVSCLYAGRGDAGLWSRLAAAGISWQFLPSVLVGIALGRARPCMGSTIAMRRETLDAIGGFAPFADRLADDHAIGEAVRALGLTVAVPPMLVTHGCAETGLAALLRHELRWAVTIRGLDPAGHAGSIIIHPMPLALVLWAAGVPHALPMLFAALVARLILALRADRRAGRRTAPLVLLPLRDMIGFGVLVASFVTRSVEWRGSRLAVAPGDRIAPTRP